RHARARGRVRPPAPRHRPRPQGAAAPRGPVPGRRPRARRPRAARPHQRRPPPHLGGRTGAPPGRPSGPGRTPGRPRMTLSDAKRCAYLGPAATFTEAALIDLLTEHDLLDTVERVPMRSQNEMFDADRRGEVDAAVVPIENSVEGGVPATLDALTRYGRLQIVAEAVVPVRFVLAALPGTVTLETLRTYGTHPHAEAQTRLWMQRHAPRAEYRPTSSTAAAAQELAASATGAQSGGVADGARTALPTGASDPVGASADAAGAPSVPYQAVIGPMLAAQAYGLEVLADDIGENTLAETRFICVERPGAIPEPTGWDRTTIVVGLASDRAGALLEMLEQLSARGVNMSRIES